MFYKASLSTYFFRSLLVLPPFGIVVAVVGIRTIGAAYKAIDQLRTRWDDKNTAYATAGDKPTLDMLPPLTGCDNVPSKTFGRIHRWIPTAILFVWFIVLLSMVSQWFRKDLNENESLDGDRATYNITYEGAPDDAISTLGQYHQAEGDAMRLRQTAQADLASKIAEAATKLKSLQDRYKQEFPAPRANQIGRKFKGEGNKD